MQWPFDFVYASIVCDCFQSIVVSEFGTVGIEYYDTRGIT